MRVERAKAEWLKQVVFDRHGVMKKKGADEAPPRGRAPVERAKAENGL